MDTMNDLQHALVDDHINALMREGASLRAERRDQLPAGATDTDVGSTVASIGALPARVRLGQWLIGVGNAIAGPTDGRGDTAGRAA